MKNLKIFAAITTFVLMIGIFAAIPAFSTQPPIVTSTYYVGTIGQPVRLDPARAYDTASGELLQNIYQTLIWWNDKHPITFTPGVGHDLVLADYSDLDSYGPVLATENPTRGNGRITDTVEGGTLWRFTINTTAMFQPWTDHLGVVHPARALTALDVVYSFRRQVVYDSLYSPDWMWMTPAFGFASWRDTYGGPYPFLPTISGTGAKSYNGTFLHAADEAKAGVSISNWCYAVGNDVYFNFTLPWAEGPLRQIFAQTWGGVVNQDWVKEMGGWDGLFTTGVSDSNMVAGWTANYHWKPTITRSELDTYKDPAVYPGHGSLYASFTQVGARGAQGTGPYKFTSWDTVNKIWRIDYDPAFWQGWANAGDKAGNYFHTVIEKGIDAWPTRKMLFLEGEFDVAAVPRANMYDLLTSTYNPITGINLAYNIAALQNDVMLFGFSVPAASPYQSYVGYPTHDGGPQQYFFNNTHMRRAFAWALDYVAYIHDAWFGEAIAERSWWVEGLSPASYKNTNASMPQRQLDLTQMQNELNLAVVDGKNVGSKGFEMTLAYNIGNDQRLIACNLIAQAFLSLGSKYKCNVVGLDWPVFLDAENSGYLPMYDVGWLADFADPDNFCEPYQASWGAFCSGQFDPAKNAQPADQAYIDNEIGKAMVEANFVTRGDMYMDLQYRYWLDVPSFPLVQPAGRRFAKDWVKGWYFNALYPGLYAFDLYKQTAGSNVVDLDISATIYPVVVDTQFHPKQFVFHQQMRNGYQSGSGNASQSYTHWKLEVARADNNLAVALVRAVAALWKTGTDVANTTLIALGPGAVLNGSLIWADDGAATFLAGSYAGTPYTLNATTQVQYPSDAVDTNQINNAVLTVNGWGTPVFTAYTLQGDATGDGLVDIFDAILLAKAFGATTTSPNWNVDTDLNGDSIIDIFDAILLAKNFNAHVP
jgi:peptide/nickel transport system substrate-binding protein